GNLRASIASPRSNATELPRTMTTCRTVSSAPNARTAASMAASSMRRLATTVLAPTVPVSWGRAAPGGLLPVGIAIALGRGATCRASFVGGLGVRRRVGRSGRYTELRLTAESGMLVGRAVEREGATDDPASFDGAGATAGGVDAVVGVGASIVAPAAPGAGAALVAPVRAAAPLALAATVAAIRFRLRVRPERGRTEAS